MYANDALGYEMVWTSQLVSFSLNGNINSELPQAIASIATCWYDSVENKFTG
jgi:hypothetical protein